MGCVAKIVRPSVGLALHLPLHIDIPRKTKNDRRVRVNLNDYRNTHFQVLNKVKHLFQDIVYGQICRYEMKPIGPGPWEFAYTLFPQTSRSLDLMNICSIVDKFTCDALVNCHMIPDDNYKVVRKLTFSFGKVDRVNPGCHLLVYPYGN